MNVTVLGVGLIGGSVALAARERAGAHVTGWDPDPAALSVALERGAVDAVAPDPATAVADADVIVVAAPLGALDRAVAEALAAAGLDAVVTDVGSTKAALTDRFGGDGRFVGGHPLAGAETAGVANARADLFDGATWYLTPNATTTGLLFERLHRFLAGLGARPVAIDAALHDRLMAGVSHLPHILANVLVAHATHALGDEEHLPATGPSFRDGTRVAGAHPALWADIYLANAPALIEALDDATLRLAAARDLLAAGDRDGLRSWQAQIADERRALIESGREGGPARELRVAVTNRPGVVADIALALGRAGIGIADMTLAPSPDNTAGVVVLWVGATDAERASRLIGDLGFAVTTS